MAGLVLDLATGGFGAVLDASGEQVLARDLRAPGSRHDDAPDWVEAMLRDAGLGLSDLTWIAAGIGPGSFTGIRIAVALAQGLAMPRRLPVHGFTSFEALHLSFISVGNIVDSENPENGGAGEASGRSAVHSVVAVIPANAGRFYVARGLDDPGALVTAETLTALLAAAPEATVLAPEITPALRAILESAGTGSTWSAAEATSGWAVGAIARRARAAGRGAARPVYLQLSAAEELFGAAEY